MVDMEKELLSMKRMILIGSTGRNSGKTTLASELIQQWKEQVSITALKITSLDQRHGGCHRGAGGCGACTNMGGCFELTEETGLHASKDTSILLAAGASRVFWLKALKSHLREGLLEFLTQIPDHALILCESNSLRKYVEPGCFIMMKNSADKMIKPSAEDVFGLADMVIENDFKDSIKKAASRIQLAVKDGEIKIQVEKN
jgi:hypothetical protein